MSGILTGEYSNEEFAQQEASQQSSVVQSLQIFAEGTISNTAVQTILSIYKEHDSNMTWGAAIGFPNGAYLKDLPLFERIPGIQFLPGLASQSYFTYTNKENGFVLLEDQLRVRVSNYGGYINGTLAYAAKMFTHQIMEGPAQRLGLELQPTTFTIGKGQFGSDGVLAPLDGLAPPSGTSVTMSGHFDWLTGEWKLAFSLSGSLSLDSDVVKFTNSTLSVFVENKFHHNRPHCKCEKEALLHCCHVLLACAEQTPA